MPARVNDLYDSLRAIPAPWYRFSSDSMQVTDSLRIRRLPSEAERNRVYFPAYLQFRGSYMNFNDYLLSNDPFLDSIVTCSTNVQLFYTGNCRNCDSGFWSASRFFPTQFNYYRYHEIYASFFAFPGIEEVQVFVSQENKTYLPYGTDLAVFAPGKSMKKKWYVHDVDYARFFPADFPASTNNDFIIDADGNFLWKEGAADRLTSPYRRK